ncbi:MAG TPA: HEAT repeat domain-containing protein, partial [Halobacteriales archaeon]|nr:HEAT repeat domain-containing protein [Halobacteriales archaeon]
MSDGDDEPAEEPSESADADEEAAVEGASLDDALASAEVAIDVEESEELGEDDIAEALDALDAALDAAETEADLDEVEAAISDVADAIDSADLPEPEEEDEEGPREELEGRVEDLRGRLEEERGPYAADVVEAIEGAKSTLTEADWTETGGGEAAEAVETFIADADEHFEADLSGDDADALDDVASAVDAADLDADEDAATIATLLEATETLESDLDDAEEWSDLTTREQLDAHG